MKLTPIDEIDDSVEFFRGTRFRMFGIHTGNVSEEEDYYDYMLAQIPGNSEYLLLTNVSKGSGAAKAGSAMALVELTDTPKKIAVKASAIKHSMGEENVFLIGE